MLEAIGYMAIGTFFALLVPVLKAWAESKDTWVDLTDDERIDIRARVQEYTPLDSVKYGEAIQRATEAILKDKNT